MFGRRGLRQAAMLATGLALAGCGGAVDTFDLSAVRSIQSRGTRGSLLVAQPVATAALDSDRILVRSAGDELAYVKGAQWSDRLPRLVQTRLVQTFENARLLRAVGRVGDGLNADRTLTGELRRFEIDTSTGQAVVEISVKVMSNQSGRIAAARLFEVRMPGSATNGKVAAESLDAALAQAMREIVAWTAGGA